MSQTYKFPNALAFLDGDVATKRFYNPDESCALVSIEQSVKKAQSRIDRLEERLRGKLKESYKTGRRRGFQSGVNAAAKTLFSNADIALSSEQHQVQLLMQALDKVLGEIPDAFKITQIAIKVIQELSQPYQLVRLIVHPSVSTEVQKAIGSMTGAPANLRIVEDDAIKVTDCLLQTELGTIDASLDIQLEAIRQSLHAVV